MKSTEKKRYMKKRRKDFVTVTFDVERTFYQEIKKEAQEDGRTVSSFLRSILKSSLGK